MMVRCVENIINTDVFLMFQTFNLFDILESSGTAWDFILAAFWMPGAYFGGPGGCWECSAILLPWLAGWLAGRGPRI